FLRAAGPVCVIFESAAVETVLADLDLQAGNRVRRAQGAGAVAGRGGVERALEGEPDPLVLFRHVAVVLSVPGTIVAASIIEALHVHADLGESPGINLRIHAAGDRLDERAPADLSQDVQTLLCGAEREIVLLDKLESAHRPAAVLVAADEVGDRGV